MWQLQLHLPLKWVEKLSTTKVCKEAFCNDVFLDVTAETVPDFYNYQ